MNTVLEQTLTAAKNIDTLNGSFIHTADLPNKFMKLLMLQLEL